MCCIIQATCGGHAYISLSGVSRHRQKFPSGAFDTNGNHGPCQSSPFPRPPPPPPPSESSCPAWHAWQGGAPNPFTPHPHVAPLAAGTSGPQAFRGEADGVRGVALTTLSPVAWGKQGAINNHLEKTQTVHPAVPTGTLRFYGNLPLLCRRLSVEDRVALSCLSQSVRVRRPYRDLPAVGQGGGKGGNEPWVPTTGTRRESDR